MNKKGFTLFELLCTIVVLALIFLILAPIMNNITKMATLGASKESINGYIRAINNQINTAPGLDKSLTISVPNNKILETGINDAELGKIYVNGTYPDYVKLTFDDTKTKVVSANFCINDKSLDYTSGTITESSNDYCTTDAPGLYDTTDTLVASWDDLVNTYNLDITKDYTYNTGYNTDYNLASTSGYSVLNTLSTGVKLVLPETIKYIGANSFRGNTTLKKLVLPKSLTEIGNYAFRNDSFAGNIDYIFIPVNSKLETIGRTAFMGNKKIKELFIPSSVKLIGGNAFRGMDLTTNAMGLEKVVFGAESELEEIGDSAFAANINLKEIYFPEKLKIIGEHAFQYCISLKELTIPASVTTIGDFAFEGYIPDSIYPNGYLMKIKTITFEADSNLEYIGERAFYYNESITSLVVPSTVKVIGKDAFSLPKLKSVTFENTSNWFYTTNKDATSGTSLDVTNPATNAANFKSILMVKWIKRS